MSEEINNPHDLLLKATLSSPQAIQELFQAHLPAHLLKRVDKQTIQLTQKSYVSSLLKEFHNDLVFSCKIDNKPGYLYLLLEHQSSPDWLLPLRFLGYNLELLKDYCKGKKAGTKWPLIINLCLYHGKGLKPYPYSTQVYDYLRDPELAQEIGMFTKFHIVNLGSLSDQELEQHGSIGLMEKMLKYSRERDLFEVLVQELERARAWLLGIDMDSPPLGEDYWKTLLVYIANVLDPSQHSEEKLINLFVEKLTKEKEEVMRTIAQQVEKRIRPQLERRIKEEGIQEGMQRGMQKGMQQGIQTRNLDIAQTMLKKGLDLSIIQEVTGLNVEQIKKLSKD